MKSPRGRRVVLLDAGGTLIRLDPDRLRAAFASTGVSPSDDAIDAAEARARLWADAGRRAELGARRVWSGYFSRMSRELGVPEGAVDATVERLWEMNSREGLWRRPVEGAAETLAELSAAGARLAVVSNAEGQVAGDLDDAGLGRYLELVVDSHLVGVSKPDPRIFEIALARLGATPDQAVYVGDVPAFDVDGARAAGIPPVLLDPHGVHEEVDAVTIRRIEELPGLLALVPPA